MRKRKDNLTDLVEHLSDAASTDNPDDGKNQQVVDADGQIVTLSLKKGKWRVSPTNKKVLELPVKDLERLLEKTVKLTVEEFEKRILEKIEERIDGRRK
jgi:hypothetical protein